MSKSVLERARNDADRGDHWLARKRLASRIASVEYDPEVLTELGRICLEMHDAEAAGRYWLTAPTEGKDVDHAIAVFLKHAGSDPKHVAAALPRGACLSDPASYPESVRRRLNALGLLPAIMELARKKRARGIHHGELGLLGKFIAIILVTLLAVVLVAGVMTLFLGLLRVLGCSHSD